MLCKENQIKLYKVISGGQTGADQAGLRAAKKAGFETGGMIPRGCLTEDGPSPELITTYNCHESTSNKYPPRTFDNVKNSDATIRFAYDFTSAGEKLTLKAILNYNRMIFDVDMTSLPSPNKVACWLAESNIAILNVAGNCERKHPGIGNKVEAFLDVVFSNYKSLFV